MKNRVRMLRGERMWSQQELAAELSVSRQTVIAIESGSSEPSLTLAFKIARTFGRSIEWVFEPESDDIQGDGVR